ncbi:MGMT family protein [Candidatus Uhrbacteria bacterium]|nr:MGMT family protein [Candidatus Uhrbacteria bacterium]
MTVTLNQTPFAQKVFEVLKKIPKGKVLTYQQVAAKAGKPNAARAVGNIIGKNYDPNIPCHRVIRSDGGLGGYNRGLALKAQILKEEGFVSPHLKT